MGRRPTTFFMELTPIEQASALLRQSTTPLILLPAEPSSDALAAGLALLVVLEKTGKPVRIVSPNFTLPPGHDFLPRTATIEQRLTSLRDFIVSVDVSRTKLESLSYDLQGDRLNIHLAPRQGGYEPKDITTSAGPFAYDLIITLDLPSLERLGPVYHENTEFFYHVPILNIDHQAENGRYGHVNLIDVVASSVSEIVFELLKSLGFEQVDEQVATSLLAGIISKTKAFQNQRVTPKSLAVASHLMTSGARREEIIQHLYQTKTLSVLKLWGRALGRLQASADQRLVWTTITADDLHSTGTKPEDAAGVIDELMTEAAKADLTCLFVEDGGATIAHVVYLSHDAPANLPAELQPRGPQYLVGRINGGLDEVSARIVATLRPTLS